MKNIVALCGLVLMSMPATPNQQNNPQQHTFPAIEKGMKLTGVTRPDKCEPCADAVLDLSEIIFIEEEVPVELGFDTADYLPEDFDPYKVYVDLDAIEFIEDDEEGPDFDTAAWLPEDFDPYAPATAISGISYMEVEEDFYPVIDTKEWLPQGFDPYRRVPANNSMMPGHDLQAR